VEHQFIRHIDLNDMLLTILTEGGHEMGYGHITRCLSVSQSLIEAGAKVSFIVNGDSEVSNILPEKSIENFDWINNERRLLYLLQKIDILLIDSMLINRALFIQIMAIVPNIVFIDDYFQWSHKKGLIIDWTVLAEKKRKHIMAPSVKYLFGATYTALRKEFWDVSERKVSDILDNVLVTFGGSDIRNLTPRILRLVSKNLPNAKTTIIIGGSYRNLEEIEAEANESTTLVYSPDAERMKECMLKADIAIASGGQTLYELARVGVPTIGIISVDNQLDDINGWEETGFLKNAGWWDSRDLEQNIVKLVNICSKRHERGKMTKIGRSFVDGQGAKRIADNIISM
jgi:UDP-2,4-diacetamido-2,4,6-trideoxy-beta-L-altropyranose hydrolase